MNVIIITSAGENRQTEIYIIIYISKWVSVFAFNLNHRDSYKIIINYNFTSHVIGNKAKALIYREMKRRVYAGVSEKQQINGNKRVNLTASKQGVCLVN